MKQISIHQIIEYRRSIHRELAAKCTPQIAALFDASLDAISQLIREAIDLAPTANNFKIYIPRPTAPEWENISMPMYELYLWHYRFNQDGMDSLEYDPLTDSLILKFYLRNEEFIVPHRSK